MWFIEYKNIDDAIEVLDRFSFVKPKNKVFKNFNWNFKYWIYIIGLFSLFYKLYLYKISKRIETTE